MTLHLNKRERIWNDRSLLRDLSIFQEQVAKVLKTQGPASFLSYNLTAQYIDNSGNVIEFTADKVTSKTNPINIVLSNKYKMEKRCKK